MVTRDVHRSSLKGLMCSAQDNFIFLTLLIMSMTFVLSLTQMFGRYAIVCDVEYKYFFPFWSVRPPVCYVLVWRVSMSLHHIS